MDNKKLKKKLKDRVYLTEEEKAILKDHVSEWNQKLDKMTRQAYVASEILPRIQELDSEKFGPERIARDKEAKALFDWRIKVHLACAYILDKELTYEGREHLAEKQQTIHRKSCFSFGKKNTSSKGSGKA
jgi:hypothetical protein